MNDSYEIVLEIDGRFFNLTPHIKIKALSLQEHGDARIGIEAPKDISIHREEIYERINGEKK